MKTSGYVVPWLSYQPGNRRTMTKVIHCRGWSAGWADATPFWLAAGVDGSPTRLRGGTGDGPTGLGVPCRSTCRKAKFHCRDAAGGGRCGKRRRESGAGTLAVASVAAACRQAEEQENNNWSSRPPISVVFRCVASRHCSEQVMYISHGPCHGWLSIACHASDMGLPSLFIH